MSSDPIVILTLWIRFSGSRYRALRLAGLEAGGARFVMAEFANEKMSYRRL